VLKGDPDRAGLYTIMLQVPAHTRIASHDHQDDRVATVIMGTWFLGYGEAFDPAQLKALPPGSVYTEPAHRAHFAETRDESVIVQPQPAKSRGSALADPISKRSPWGPEGREWIRSAKLPPAIRHEVLMRLIGLAVVFALSLTLAPFASEAQQATKATIGILAIEAFPPIDSFRQVLRELGYVEDRDIRYEYRYAEGRNQRFRELAEDLVALKVDVILTWGTEAALEAKRATKTIPIVMGAMGNPVGQGVVSSLAHPGGNVTGLTSLATDLERKRLEILKEIVPNLSLVAVLSNPTTDI
jgi:hypothetical protein